MREESQGHYEMLWDCGYCSTTKLLGITHRYCPNCGAPQDPTRRYYPDDGDKVAAVDHAYAGRDKICPACSNPVGAACTFCGHCGSTLDSAGDVVVRKQQLAQGGRYARDSAEHADAEAKGLGIAGTPARQKGKRGWLIGLLVVAVLIALVYTLCFWKQKTTLEVTGQRWARTIEIEELREVRETAWRDQLPRDAERVSCHREQRGTRQVEDGETCTMKRVDKGDGTFEEIRQCVPKYRSEPEYDDRCSYTARRWQVRDTAKKTGSGVTPAPEWPEVKLERTGSGLGAQREGRRAASHTLELVDKGGSKHSCDVAEATWRRHGVGARLSGETKRVGGTLECDSLAPARK